nr:MAG TPA: hypothetical protein [Caudoviricetes sp.]
MVSQPLALRWCFFISSELPYPSSAFLKKYINLHVFLLRKNVYIL